MTEPSVVILGGGPSGIMAYYGALAAGFKPYDVELWTNKAELSFPCGAFWLHEIPRNLNFASDTMLIKRIGTPEGYSLKQWGQVFTTSIANYADEESITAYDPYIVLPKLWSICNVHVKSQKFTGDDVQALAKKVPFVIQTFPTDWEVKALIDNFRFPVYTAKIHQQGANLCVYNGRVDTRWVRMTLAFGYVSYEYPRMGDRDVETQVKTQNNNWQTEGEMRYFPDMHPLQQPVEQRVIGPQNNILLTGRWATLDRKALSHTSYWDTKKFLQGSK